MGNTKKVIYSGREFVNLPGSDDTGYIQAEIKWESSYNWDDNDDENPHGKPGHIEYMLKFADCNRIIDFNIYGDTEKGRKNSIHKINSMIEILTGFKKGLIEAFIGEEHIKNVDDLRKKEAEETRKKEDSKKNSKKIILTKPRLL